MVFLWFQSYLVGYYHFVILIEMDKLSKLVSMVILLIIGKDEENIQNVGATQR